MNPTLKRYVLSSLSTFITVELATVSLQLSAGGIEWTWAFWFSVGMVAFRAGVKAVIEALANQHADWPE